jgi:hypothetical protein
MEFVCEDWGALVRAANVRATLDAFSLVPEMGKRLIARHALDLDDLTPDKFVPVQKWLNALKELQDHVGAPGVRRVGTRIVEQADFPPHFDSVESILLELDTIYYLNHKGDVGHYLVSKHGSALVIVCETPYPRAFELGLIEGICRSGRAKRKYFISSEHGAPGGRQTCTVTVRPQ